MLKGGNNDDGKVGFCTYVNHDDHTYTPFYPRKLTVNKILT